MDDKTDYAGYRSGTEGRDRLQDLQNATGESNDGSRSGNRDVSTGVQSEDEQENARTENARINLLNTHFPPLEAQRSNESRGTAVSSQAPADHINTAPKPRTNGTRIIGIDEREADSDEEEEKQNPGAETTSRYTKELFQPAKNSAKARADERKTNLLPHTNNPYEQLADINESEAEDEETKETASQQRAAKKSLMSAAFSLDPPRLKTEKSPTDSPKIQDSQSKEDGQLRADANSETGSPGVKPMSSGEVTPRGEMQEGRDIFSAMLNQTVKYPAKWAEANDDDLPMIASMYTKGRPPEDQNHTPDQGNAHKRRQNQSTKRWTLFLN
ncbi:hypothetical protein R1sor_008721 [Riccia sorocarpa]|uniref:Uncharacterized protein n=1 Tax=Riccia sorocarpa TaxID=122646 RepID=A0ABD3HU85_9MARC